MSAVIRAEGIWKRYNVRPAETLWRMLRRVNPWRGAGSTSSEFWALRDVSFEVQQGESLGIIGSNGAGKTTLLKILCGVTRATRGTVVVNGRIAPLIELSAGFHPELTGRENIYLNAAIMGMSKAEIHRKFDEIVAFSELEAFIDTPVKKYSSGMLVRLGFSVAAHTEPDVLLVDEVLSVGDVGFRRKCMARARELQESGATIVFVSHDMHAVEAICGCVMVLDSGSVVFSGPPGDAIHRYEGLHLKRALADRKELYSEGTAWSTGEVELEDVEFLDARYQPRDVFLHDECLIARVHYNASTRLNNVNISINVFRDDGLRCCNERSKYHGVVIPELLSKGYFDVVIEKIGLKRGVYTLAVALSDANARLVDHYAWRRRDKFAVEDDMATVSEGVFHLDVKWVPYPNETVDPSGPRDNAQKANTGRGGNA